MKIVDNFPNLLGFSAGKCTLKTISKENFQGLIQLKELLLFENFIENIPVDVFEGLVALEFINLGEEKFI